MFRTVFECYENGSEWGRHESPRAHVRRGRSHGLSDASGSPPDPIWGGFKLTLVNFQCLGTPLGKKLLFKL